MGIAQHLTDRKIPTPADKGNTINQRENTEYAVWFYNVIRRMIANPVYKGEWQYGKRTDNPITIRIPRIISDEDWAAANKIRKANRRVRKHAGDYDYLLRGMTSCYSCGKPMPANTQRHGERTRSYYKHYWPRVPGSNNGNRCAGNGYYRAEGVDKAMWGYVSELVSDPAILSDAFREYGERLRSGNSPTRDKLETAQKRLTSTERKLSRLLDLYLDEAITKKQYTARKKPLDIQLGKYSDDVDALSQELEQSSKLEEHMLSITKFTETVATVLEQDKGIAHRREVIKRLGLRAELG